MKNHQGTRAPDRQRGVNYLLDFFQAVNRRGQGTQGQTPSPASLMVGVPDGAITEEEVWDSLKIPASKAAGPDEIHPALLKPPTEVLVKPRTQLFSASLDEGRLPLYW